jgi:endonuclease/exonuclease/phosphatase family metal-dependent hydrolase
MNVRLLSYNIRYGGAGREASLASTIDSIAPDVVVLQEANRPDVVRQLAERTGMKHWGSSPGHSVGFMSRLEVGSHEWHKPRGCPRALLEIPLAGITFTIFGIHLRAIHSNWSERNRAHELDVALRAIAHRRTGVHVLTGDFNTLAPGERLDLARLPRRLQILTWLLGRKIQWGTIQTMLDAGYLDGFRLLHPDLTGHTFPTWDPHLRLDYAFLPGTEAERLRQCDVITTNEAGVASDHFPLLSVLELETGEAPKL